MTNTAGRSRPPGSNAALRVVLHKLWSIDLPKATRHRRRRAARLQATRWLLELEDTECPEETWSKFEVWIRQHADHGAMYLQAERTRQVVDNLGRFCPRGGTAEAERLLEVIHSWPRQRRGTIVMLTWTTVGLLIAVAAILLALHETRHW